MPQYAPVLELSSLNGANGFQINGEAAGDGSGWSVSSAGDVNGDGFDDLIVGASDADPNGLSSGASYVVFGKASGFGATLELSSLNGANGFQINGEAADDFSGFSVSSAGDVNGDGFDDLIVGARRADSNGSNSGASYVVFGKASGFAATLELSSLNGASGFQINGEAASDYSGLVSSAGDINGDGFDDLIVGAGAADPNGSASGASYVVFGKASGFGATLELSSLNGANGFQINGEAAGDSSGFSVASAGDVNGDGFADLIVGARYADPNGSLSGASYVVFGKASGFGATLELSSLDGANGFQISGEAVFDESGFSVASAGDVNGDGFDDLIVGARGADPNGGNSGASYVVFGKASGFTATLELSSLNGANGFQISGEAAGDRSGSSVSSAGDFNGDGFDDLIVGARSAGPNGAQSGASYVVFGKASGFAATLELSSLNGANGFQINGEAAYDNSGRSVSSAGDVNGDGFADLIVSAHYADPNGLDSGASYVIFGAMPGEAVTRIGTAIANIIHGGNFNDVLVGLGGADTLNGGDGDDQLVGETGFSDDSTTGGADTLDGGAGNDYLRGGAGADTFIGGAGFDRVSFFAKAATAGVVASLITQTITNDGFGNAETMSSIEGLGGGTAFVDTLVGDDNNNFLLGGIGDILTGNGGDDLFQIEGASVLNGGAGNDTITEFTGASPGFGAITPDGADPDILADIIFAPSGVIVDLGLGSIVDDGFGNSSVIVSIENVGGSILGDTLTGSGATNTLWGFAGDDNLSGGGGSDTLFGGDGADQLSGDFFNDTTGGADTLNGEAGDDLLRGGAGVDIFIGGSGIDRVSFFTRAATQAVVANLITQTIGNDGFGNVETMSSIEGLGAGTAFADSFTGDNNANSILGGIGDIVNGNGGNDSFQIDGALALNGGAGNDTISQFIAAEFGALTPDANADGLAEIIFATQGVIVDLGLGSIIDDGFGNTSTILSIENVGGSILGDTLTGSGAANRLLGLAGDDILVGRGGADILSGGTGADTMRGGDGNDTYEVDNVGDITTESSAAGGTDLVQSSVTRTLGANLENLTLTGSAAINGTGNTQGNIINGNSVGNTLTGRSGADTLIGGGGGDRLIGGLGLDILTGGIGADKFVFNSAVAAADRDTITDYNVAADTIQITSAAFVGIGAAGVLAATAFHTGASAADASDRIIYDATNGKLFFDADGIGGATQIQFATLSTGLLLTAADFVVI